MIAIGDPLLATYNRPVPRYTSYPPASEFDTTVTDARYVERLEARDPARPLSLYVHVPFCERLCLYCGCNVIISRNSARSDEYLDLVELEATRVASHLKGDRRISSVHLGGGSPNSLTVPQLERLMGMIDRVFGQKENALFALEANPAQTSPEFLQAARRLGFSRISLGVQDLSPVVLGNVGRECGPDDLVSVYRKCRELGFSSINFDLMYGLPGQTVESVLDTVRKVVELRPDRVAVFGYAHVPWFRPQQKLLPEDKLPNPRLRADMVLAVREAFIEGGYVPIGIDHYALASDDLARGLAEHRLRRSFQGYTVEPDGDLIGLGASAITSLYDTYAQNAPHLPDYRRALEEGGLPVVRGALLTPEAIERRRIIMEIMCHGSLRVDDRVKQFVDEVTGELSQLELDGLLRRSPQELEATDVGSIFLRRIASAFDTTPSRTRGSSAM
ncbi:MAG: oxygen-independent coproporphyrinogen III oxidase [Deltaproteobacteria bacterium]|nr:oxygen-independent coproporphyrinogen III oxidase [Deltaproteobacteria bacterium]